MNYIRCDFCGAEQRVNNSFWITLDMMLFTPMEKKELATDFVEEPIKHFCNSTCFWDWARREIEKQKGDS